MNDEQKRWIPYIIGALLVGIISGYLICSRIHDNTGTIQRMEAALTAANATNQRVTAERDKLQQLNLGLTDENNRSKQLAEQLRKYNEELAGQLGEVWDYVNGLELNHSANEVGLAE